MGRDFVLGGSMPITGVCEIEVGNCVVILTDFACKACLNGGLLVDGSRNGVIAVSVVGKLVNDVLGRTVDGLDIRHCAGRR
jgi:hypothetical protein